MTFFIFLKSLHKSSDFSFPGILKQLKLLHLRGKQGKQSRQRWCCSCTGAEDKSEISEEEEGAPTGGDISQQKGERRQEEERRAHFLCDLFIYDQPLREVGALAAQRGWDVSPV